MTGSTMLKIVVRNWLSQPSRCRKNRRKNSFVGPSFVPPLSNTSVIATLFLALPGFIILSICFLNPGSMRLWLTNRRYKHILWSKLQSHLHAAISTAATACLTINTNWPSSIACASWRKQRANSTPGHSIFRLSTNKTSALSVYYLTTKTQALSRIALSGPLLVEYRTHGARARHSAYQTRYSPRTLNSARVSDGNPATHG